MSHLNVTDRAPDFELVDGRGETHRLSDYRGQVVVLAFYPMDFSGVCTEEHACFVDNLAQFEKLDAQVLGISIDSRPVHAAFAKQLGITYPLLADFHPKGEVGRRYGVYLDDYGYHGRANFVIDPEGRISFIQEMVPSDLPDFDELIEQNLRGGPLGENDDLANRRNGLW